MSALSTDRLILRRWQESDLVPFATLNSDPRVMEFFPQLLSRAESDALVDRINEHFARHGFGLYAAELTATHEFIGYIGLAVATFAAPFTPRVEIGWRLTTEHWGQGLATEGARAIVNHAFGVLELESIVSFTVPHNMRSRRVMEKIGMTHNPIEDFDHPALPVGHALQRHVLYRLGKEEWRKGSSGECHRLT
jgi:RimJ/RimL family protein N-acetyltransferase